MTASNAISATTRELIGKSSRRLAYRNEIPAVVYGGGRDPKSISINRHDFEQWLLHHAAGSTVIELKLEDEKQPLHAMIRELHHSPVKGNVLHVDFLVIAMDKVTTATVPLHLVNDSEGVKAGGVMSVNLHEVSVEALPADIPQGGIDVDVSALNIGDALHVSDITSLKNVTILDDPETIICSVQAPRAEEEEEVEEAAEPEVIGAKDEEE